MEYARGTAKAALQKIMKAKKRPFAVYAFIIFCKAALAVPHAQDKKGEYKKALPVCFENLLK